MLEKYNVDLSLAKQCIENNKHNQITSLYYLLLNKYKSAGYNQSTETVDEFSDNKHDNHNKNENDDNLREAK